MRVLCTQGYFDASGEGSLVAVDLARGSAQVVLRYTPPEPLRVSAKGFTGAAWAGAPGRSPLFVCGHAAIYRVDVDALQVVDTWHQGCMNDLHHLALTPERLYLVNTGNESLDVFGLDGLFLGSHGLHAAWFSAARHQGRSCAREDMEKVRSVRGQAPPALEPVSASGYYSDVGEIPFHQRKVRDFFHPNHVTLGARQVLVTLMQSCSVQDISTFAPVIEDTPGHPHDGVLCEEEFVLTCASGLVVSYAAPGGVVSGRELWRLDLFATTGRSGWCRGLLVTREHLVIGLSQISRPPRYRWCERPYQETETAVLCVDRRTGRLEARVDLTDTNRQAKIFSILPWPV